MNREEIVARIDQIKMSQDSLKGQFSTLQGHLDEATFWLAKLDEELEEVEEVAPVVKFDAAQEVTEVQHIGE